MLVIFGKLMMAYWWNYNRLHLYRMTANIDR